MRALRNPRFRALLLAVAGIPIGTAYVLVALVRPLSAPGDPRTDFGGIYYPAAQVMRRGGDIYSAACRGYACVDPNIVSVQPPAMTWLLQPLAAVPFPVADALAVVAVTLLLAVTLALSLAAAGVRSAPAALALGLAFLGWAPVLKEVHERQPELLVAALSAGWLAAYARRRGAVAGGVALGIGAAIKLQPGPLLVLVLARRRWAMAAAAVAAGGVLWLVASPALLIPYFEHVFPLEAAGIGSYTNVSPAGSLARLASPDSFWVGAPGQSAPWLRAAALGFGLALAALTAIVAWRSPGPQDADRRLLEGSVAMSATLFLSPLTLVGHLVLLVPALVAVTAVAARRRSLVALALVAFAWTAMGPAFALLDTVARIDPYAHWALYPLSHLALAGQLALWAAALLELRRGPVGEAAAAAAPGSARLGPDACDRDRGALPVA